MTQLADAFRDAGYEAPVEELWRAIDAIFADGVTSPDLAVARLFDATHLANCWRDAPGMRALALMLMSRRRRERPPPRPAPDDNRSRDHTGENVVRRPALPQPDLESSGAAARRAVATVLDTFRLAALGGIAVGDASLGQVRTAARRAGIESSVLTQLCASAPPGSDNRSVREIFRAEDVAAMIRHAEAQQA
jgi:hypothetical protein